MFPSTWFDVRVRRVSSGGTSRSKYLGFFSLTAGSGKFHLEEED